MSQRGRFQLKGDRLQLSENDVRKGCLDLLRARGWWPIRQHVGKFLPGKVYGLLCPACRAAVRNSWVTIGEAGDPDYAAIRRPSFFLETKRPGGDLSEGQRTRIETLRRFYNLDTVVVASVEELLDWLDQNLPRK
jgi:hypothetical protein